MKKLKQINLNGILFLDIETVPQWETLNEAPEHVRKEWIYKMKFKPDAPAEPNPEKNAVDTQEFIKNKYAKYFTDLWEKKAGLYAEFSKIVCISMGYVYKNEARIKSYSNSDEEHLLSDFKEDLGLFVDMQKTPYLCAHFGEGFDFPFINKRLLIHGQDIPNILDTWEVKPWETNLIDTQKVWKFGHFGADSATLSSIAMAFGIPTPKDDIDGSQVAGVYYRGKGEGEGVNFGLKRITKYCEKDVFTLMQIVKKMRGEALLPALNDNLFSNDN